MHFKSSSLLAVMLLIFTTGVDEKENYGCANKNTSVESIFKIRNAMIQSKMW